MFEVHLGFSTTGGPLSRLIRWATGARASHCFLRYRCDTFGDDMVLEATGAGFRVMAWKRFDRTNKLVAEYRVNLPGEVLREGLVWIGPRLGDAYDTVSLVGYLLRSWFSLRRVPFNSRQKLVCSEAVGLYLQHCGIDVGRPRVLTPRDLLALAERRPDLFELRATGRAYRRRKRLATGAARDPSRPVGDDHSSS